MKLSPEVVAALRSAHTIAVVGLSSDPARPSYGVARYLQQNGFHIIPVNPHETEVLGEPAVVDLDHLPVAATAVDIVDVFRRSEFVPDIAAAAIRIGARMLWLQEGVSHPEAEKMAAAAGLVVVSDHCLLKAHARLKADEEQPGAQLP